MVITISDRRSGTPLNEERLRDEVLTVLSRDGFTLVDQLGVPALNYQGSADATRRDFMRLLRILPVLGMTANVATSLAEARALKRPNPLVFHTRGHYRIA